MSESNNFLVSATNAYSQALYELAVEEKSLNYIENQVIGVIKLISNSRDFNELVKDPTINQKNLSQIMVKIGEKFNFNELLKKFFNFLIEKRRLFYIEKILKDFLIICSKMRGEIVTKLTSAKNLNNDEINKIKNELKANFGSNIKLNYKYDPTLIGGLVIQMGSVMIDASLKNKLKQIENKMIEA